MERDPYEAAKNRVRIGTAPKFGARVYGRLDEIPPGGWHVWRMPLACAALNVRSSEPRRLPRTSIRPRRVTWRIEIIKCQWCPAEWVCPVGSSWRRVECPDCTQPTGRGLTADVVWSEC